MGQKRCSNCCNRDGIPLRKVHFDKWFRPSREDEIVTYKGFKRGVWGERMRDSQEAWIFVAQNPFQVFQIQEQMEAASNSHGIPLRKSKVLGMELGEGMRLF